MAASAEVGLEGVRVSFRLGIGPESGGRELYKASDQSAEWFEACIVSRVKDAKLKGVCAILVCRKK